MLGHLDCVYQVMDLTRISSSESVSFIFLAIMVKNSAHGLLRRMPLQLKGLALTRKVDCAIVVRINLVDHILQLRFAWVLAERPHDSA